jgi:exonuclease SbcC
MIQTIQLNNFQKHKDLRLNLEPGLNIISGASDTGKSAVIRALRYVCLHEVLPKSFTTHGETHTGVSVLFSKPQTTCVTRFRNTKESGYLHNTETYVAVKNEQPDAVKQAINLSDINFQSQHDSPFLLGLSPGQVAKEINKVVDLQAIDLCQKWFGTEIRRNRTLLESSEHEVTGHTLQLEELSWVPEASTEWADVKASGERLDALSESVTRLSDLLTKCLTLDAEGRKMAPYVRELKAVVSELLDVASASDKLIADILRLNKLISDYRRSFTVQADFRYVEELAAVYQEPDCPDVSRLSSAICKFREISKEISELEPYIVDLRDIITASEGIPDLTSAAHSLATVFSTGLQIRDAEKEIAELQAKLKVCPSCGKSFTKAK